MPVVIGDLHQQLVDITREDFTGHSMPVRVLSSGELFNVSSKNNSIVFPGTRSYMQECSLYAVYGYRKHDSGFGAVLVGMSPGGCLYAIGTCSQEAAEALVRIVEERLSRFADDNIAHERQIHCRWALGDITGLPSTGRKPHFKLALRSIWGRSERGQRLLRKYRDGYRNSVQYHHNAQRIGAATRQIEQCHRATLLDSLSPYSY